MLRKLPRQGGVDREVQEFLYHGRAGVLPPQDLLLERTEARLARAFPRPHPPKEEGKELEQSRNALSRKRNEDGRPDCCSVNRVPCPSPPIQCILSLQFSSISSAAYCPCSRCYYQKSATSWTDPDYYWPLFASSH